jgi:hypothetical protein
MNSFIGKTIFLVSQLITQIEILEKWNHSGNTFLKPNEIGIRKRKKRVIFIKSLILAQDER